MTSRELLDGILQTLPEDRLQEVLDFARFLSLQEDSEAWREFGRRQFAHAFGEDEPEYSRGDIERLR
jgi:DnaJ-domain-containing protein 1